MSLETLMKWIIKIILVFFLLFAIFPQTQMHTQTHRRESYLVWAARRITKKIQYAHRQPSIHRWQRHRFTETNNNTQFNNKNYHNNKIVIHRLLKLLILLTLKSIRIIMYANERTTTTKKSPSSSSSSSSS